MLPIAGQTARPNRLKLFVDTQGWPVDVKGKIFFVIFIFFPKFFSSTGNAGPFS